jgi:hypothetical protein
MQKLPVVASFHLKRYWVSKTISKVAFVPSYFVHFIIIVDIAWLTLYQIMMNFRCCHGNMYAQYRTVWKKSSFSKFYIGNNVLGYLELLMYQKQEKILYF